MYVSSVASDIRLFSLGYSDSFDKKKQYVQSILHVDPLGLANRWKAGGALSGTEFSVKGVIFLCHLLVSGSRTPGSIVFFFPSRMTRFIGPRSST